MHNRALALLCGTLLPYQDARLEFPSSLSTSCLNLLPSDCLSLSPVTSIKANIFDSHFLCFDDGGDGDDGDGDMGWTKLGCVECWGEEQE